VLCVEDDPLVREYLVKRLSLEPDISLVGTACDVNRALIFLRRGDIDVVLLDNHLPGLDGTDLLISMRPWPNGPRENDSSPRILFCTGVADESFVARARTLGADGVIGKDRVTTELIPAVRAVAGGGCWFPQESSVTG
jgi:DNA-binding NarL/FixJ family response regulator